MLELSVFEAVVVDEGIKQSISSYYIYLNYDAFRTPYL